MNYVIQNQFNEEGMFKLLNILQRLQFPCEAVKVYLLRSEEALMVRHET